MELSLHSCLIRPFSGIKMIKYQGVGKIFLQPLYLRFQASSSEPIIHASTTVRNILYHRAA